MSIMKKSNKGFTLIELLIVIAMSFVVAAIIGMKIKGDREKNDPVRLKHIELKENFKDRFSVSKQFFIQDPEILLSEDYRFFVLTDNYTGDRKLLIKSKTSDRMYVHHMRDYIIELNMEDGN